MTPSRRRIDALGSESPRAAFVASLCASAGLAVLIALPEPARAADPVSAGEPEQDDPQPEHFTGRVAASRPHAHVPDERSVTTVTREDIERRQVRSAPDALRYEAGVFVQQTAHGQGSAFIRGLTGQQTLLLFDGIRLNNSTYRQGPNQYFFTLDSQTIGAIDVLRGGGSTRGGSDALGGMISAYPIEAIIPADATPGLRAAPLITGRGTTADKEFGGRAQISLTYVSPRGFTLGFIGGAGAREVGLLESAGPVINPNPDTPLGPLPWVPRFLPDGRTQLGTGFKEVTADGNLQIRFSRRQRLTAAVYIYRQYDVPRTDQCPPPTAPVGVCTSYDEQFRHFAYVAWDAQLGAAAQRLRVSVSYQQQHEKRRYEDPTVLARQVGLDDVNTIGLVANASTAQFQPHSLIKLRLSYGLDNYVDLLSSRQSLMYTDVNITVPLSRGQYVDGSRYFYGGAYADGEIGLGSRVVVRGGARLSWIHAGVPEDQKSGSQPVDKTWVPVVGHVGLEVRAAEALRLLLNIDNSYRAPNLNDLTARQVTGPGFQFENAALSPERAWTFELGGRLRSTWVHADLFGFQTLIDGLVLKVAKRSDDCPANTPQCNGAWSRFQLQNAIELSQIRGVEGTLQVFTPIGLWLRATLAYAYGDGPRIGDLTQETYGVTLSERVPLSRIPPLNGTAEINYRHAAGLFAGASLRWATLQDRLAIADYSDGRIPKYGTPGFAVLDLRLGYQVGEHITVGATVENVFDTPYRYHGSSINGPGRGLVLSLKLR